MEAEVVKKTGDMVYINTAVGNFNGIWCSSNPVALKKYVVELDSDEVLTLDAIECSDISSPSIECVNQSIFITGLVEEIQDRVMTLRLQGYIMMLEILSDLDFIQYVGCYVRVCLREIKIYDTSIY